MEENKAFTVKQTQAGDDSGYSCTSTQSKYSQSASSGYSCFEERRSTTLKMSEDGKMSTSNSKSIEQPNQITQRDVSGLETTANIESSNNKNSKSEQINVTAFEPQMDQLFSIDELKQTPSTSNIEIDKSDNLNNDTKEDHDRNNLAFLQLITLCKSYREYLNTKNETSNLCDEPDTVPKELNEHEKQLKEIIESNEVRDDSFGFVISMNDGLIINTSNNIQKVMGYPKDMGQGRSFIDFIHPKDHMSFMRYVTSVLIDPCKISKQDGISTVTFLKAKNNDGFYCNMRRYRGLNTGYSIYKKKNHYQVCKLTITFKNVSCASTSSCLVQINKIRQSQLHLIVKAQLIHSAYTYTEEKKECPVSFITKHNALFEWCYVDHLIVSHLGYLPQNIIGKSIFNYYNIEDLPIIKEMHENTIKPISIPYKGNPYRLKCQNGDFALVQTEWSNFVNPWSGQVEFVIGRHKVIQGPINPDVITLVDDIMYEAKLTDDKTNPNEIYEDIKKLLNKNINETTNVSHQTNQTSSLSTDLKNQKSKKCKDLASYMNNCFVEDIDPAIQVPLEVKIQPETCGFSNHDSVILGEISPHTSISSSGTPPSYTQLNYNDNILRFFKSNLQLNSSEDLNDPNCPKEMIVGKVTHFETNMDKAQQNKTSLLQNVIPNSSIIVNCMSTSCSEQNSSQNIKSQQPLTQKMLLRHNKKMEDDLVNQHKNNAKRIKSSVKQKQHLPDENTVAADVVTHGIKRNMSSQYENKSCKITKIKHFVSNNQPTNVNTPTQTNEEIATTHTVARATQIWPPCKITRDSQTMIELPRSPTVLPNYNVPLGNNVMPGKHNEYENPSTLMRPHEQNQESLSNQLQLLTVPLYASIPVMNHISQSAPILQPCSHYHNQILLQHPYQNVEFKPKMDPMQNETSIPILSNTFYQKTKSIQVNQEEIITSSDSEYSSFYSPMLRYKTDSSDKEECSCSPDFIKTNCPKKFIEKHSLRMENVVTTPDIIFRYQMEHWDINTVLQKDMNALNTLTQPLLVNEQLKQLCVELNVNGTSKTSYYEDGSSSSGGDECLISIGNNKKRKVNYSRMAMIYEENAPLPPPTTSPRLMSSNTNQSTE